MYGLGETLHLVRGQGEILRAEVVGLEEDAAVLLAYGAVKGLGLNDPVLATGRPFRFWNSARPYSAA